MSRSARAPSRSTARARTDARSFFDKRVSVREEVEHVLGPNLFTLSDGEFFGTSPDILVFAPNAEAMPNENTTVTVTGTVRKFTHADLQRAYGWGWGYYPWGLGYYGYGYPWYAPVGRDYWVQYETRPIVIATSVVTPAGVQLVSKTNSTESGAVGTSERAGNGSNIVTDMAKLTGASSAQYAGQHVHLQNVTVDRVTSKRGFWTTSGVFVALDQDIRDPNVKAGDQVTLAGRVAKTPNSDSGRIERPRAAENRRRQIELSAAVGDLRTITSDGVGRKAVCRDESRERLAVHVLHHDEAAAIRLAAFSSPLPHPNRSSSKLASRGFGPGTRALN